MRLNSYWKFLSERRFVTQPFPQIRHLADVNAFVQAEECDGTAQGAVERRLFLGDWLAQRFFRDAGERRGDPLSNFFKVPLEFDGVGILFGIYQLSTTRKQFLPRSGPLMSEHLGDECAMNDHVTGDPGEMVRVVGRTKQPLICGNASNRLIKCLGIGVEHSGYCCE